MMRWLCCCALLLPLLVAASPQTPPKSERVKLVGLDMTEIEKRIGPPAEKEDLPDSNEAYWIYKTKAGTLSVHFQNLVVVDIDPADFPVETILR
jgi:hypothetical protein